MNTPAPRPDAPAGCEGGDLVALRVIGHSMEPEFREGEIVVVEPDGAAVDGSFVIAWHAGEWTLRQLRRDGAAWRLHALNPAWPETPEVTLEAVHGVVIQKAQPGRRRATRRYV